MHRHAPSAPKAPFTALLRRALTTITTTTVLTVGLAGIADAEPPNIPDPETARALLAELTVAPDGYDRDKFPHWSEQGDSCNTREAVLKRDGTDVHTGTDCYPTSGSWLSPYDDATWSEPSDVDIDHVVPLAEAWRLTTSGDEKAALTTSDDEVPPPERRPVPSTLCQSGGRRGRRIRISDELRTTQELLGLTDVLSGPRQGRDRPQKSLVGTVTPGNRAAALPPGPTQLVEPAVVARTGIGIGGDGLTGLQRFLGQCGPGRTEIGVLRRHLVRRCTGVERGLRVGAAG